MSNNLEVNGIMESTTQRTMTRIAILTVTIAVVSVLSQPKEQQIYQHQRLEKICPLSGGKVQIALKTGVSVFTFTSLLMDTEVFKCHLELGVNSASYGFSVFIEEMTMEGSGISGCQEDFIQFGRDILFVTSHKSRKYCGVVETPVAREGKGASGFMFPVTPLAKRIYTEEKDKEMDMWVKASRPPLGAMPKTFSLVITPFKKYCGQNDLYYRQCRYSTKCVRKELFCDGRVNCAWPYSEPADEVYCIETSSENSTVWRIANVPVIFIVLIIIILSLMLLCCGIKKFSDRVKKLRETNNGSDSIDLSDTPEEGEHFHPHHLHDRERQPSHYHHHHYLHHECHPPVHPPHILYQDCLSPHGPPINPPSYSESCLPTIPTITPPKYSILPQRSYTTSGDLSTD